MALRKLSDLSTIRQFGRILIKGNPPPMIGRCLVATPIGSVQQARRTIHTHDLGGSRTSARASEKFNFNASEDGPRIGAVFEQTSSRSVAVELIDGRRFEFPLIWLRDNCQCRECFHPGSYSRILNWENIDVDSIRLKNCSKNSAGDTLKLLWIDDHISEFPLDWLVARNFSEDNCSDYLNEWYRPKARFWGQRDFPVVLKNFEYSDVISDDGALREWIESLIRFGIVMIKNAPLDDEVARKLANRIGFIRRTHYGDEYIIKAKEETSNVAYLAAPLQMHTDLPYYEYLPGCNLLHYIVQTESAGGQNLIVDAMYVAERLRQEHPDDFRLLSETLVNWCDVGTDEGRQFHSIYRAPVICLGRDGSIERILQSIPQRDSFFNIPMKRVEPWYRALAKFIQMIYQESVQFKTASGDILAFSNVRMLHGRKGYTDTDANTRHVVGAFMDWDEIYSRWRVLKGFQMKLQHPLAFSNRRFNSSAFTSQNCVIMLLICPCHHSKLRDCQQAIAAAMRSPTSEGGRPGGQHAGTVK
ncbi:gamma-butyrobetaine dioxygenase-like [Uranotaenia lowii]|uniref:gamma-butyrobetaine dioxygenase-like n=1 Tax=Uranotaenia lowii TaxID=190385 RepID=UPI00247B154C|nr:gamma-butyrobetaine dioxygenase-like [Uranotaenia lowii]